jgi:hypothetical protein
MSMATVKRNVVVGLAVALFTATLGMVLLSFRLYKSLPEIQILDTRFQVASVMVYKGTNTPPIYFENQVAGHMKGLLAVLGRRLGLRVKAPTRLPSTFLISGFTGISVAFRGQFTRQELETVQAELLGKAGKAFPLQGCAWADARTNCLGTWLIDPLDYRLMRAHMTNAPRYCLRIRLANQGPELAQIEVRAPQR